MLFRLEHLLYFSLSFKEEEGLASAHKVIKLGTKLAAFWYETRGMTTHVRKHLPLAWWTEFHGKPHLDRVHFLEENDCTVWSLIFILHMNMTYLGCYGCDEVIKINQKKFDGETALKEIGMLVYLAAVDNRRTAYTFDAEHNAYVYAPPAPAEDDMPPTVAVCGLHPSVLDERNRPLLNFLEGMYKKCAVADEYELQAPLTALTSKGSHGMKGEFPGSPVFLEKKARRSGNRQESRPLARKS